MNNFAVDATQISDYTKLTVSQLPRETVTADGKTHFLKYVPVGVDSSAKDEYGSKIKLYGKCTLIYDITELTDLKLNVQKLEAEVDNLEKLILLPSWYDDMQNQEKMLLISNFIVIDIIIRPGLSLDKFEEIIDEISSTSESYTTLMYKKLQRFSFFLLFNTYSSETNRQYIKDALSLGAHLMSIYSDEFKMSILNGSRCLFEINQTDHEYVSLYSDTFMVSSTILKEADFGEVIVDRTIMKSLMNIQYKIERFGQYNTLNGKIDFCIIKIPDMQREIEI